MSFCVRVVKIDGPAGHILKPRTRCLGRDVRGNWKSLDYETLFQNHVFQKKLNICVFRRDFSFMNRLCYTYLYERVST